MIGGSEQLHCKDASSASITRNSGIKEKLKLHGRYDVVCRGPDGKIKWESHIDNLVTTEGENDLLNKYLAGSAYTASFFLGLISSTGYTSGPADTDTMALHPGWVEGGLGTVPIYSQVSRPAALWAPAASGIKAFSAGVLYSITTGGTFKGCFLTTVSTKDGTGGLLFSAGTFFDGDKVVSPVDSLTVTYSLAV